jgi:hypothetical protein
MSEDIFKYIYFHNDKSTSSFWNQKINWTIKLFHLEVQI